jgi:sporulation integral membrane protein YlbJ
MALIISNPSLFSSSTIKGLKLFFYSVLPGLLPFMFLTKLLTELGTIFKITKKLSPVSQKLFGTPGVSLYCFFMSVLSGYPIGAKIISDLYAKKLISEEDAKRMSIFCTTSGPIFVIGAIGVGMLGNLKLGAIIYISHILSSLLLGIIYNIIFKSKNKEPREQIFIQPTQITNIISFCLSETINSLFLVAGYITIFYLASEILENLKVFDFLTSLIVPLFSKIQPSHVKAFLFGILEVTRGAKELSIFGFSCAPVICGLVSFSGISIIMQSLSFLKTAKIKAHNFIFSKCVLGIFSILICNILIFMC